MHPKIKASFYKFIHEHYNAVLGVVESEGMVVF